MSSIFSTSFRGLAIGSISFTLLACSQESSRSAMNAEPAETLATTAMGEMTAGAAMDSQAGLGINPDNMDSSVRPQDDFYRFVNGGWDDSTEIPEDRSRWGSFDELNETADQRVLAILRDLATGDIEDTEETAKMADIFSAFMDEARIEALGIQPLADELADIDALDSYDALLSYWAVARANGLTGPFSFAVTQDQQQSDQYITLFYQSGLGMPDREYYLDDAERFAEIRESYRAHIIKLFELAELPDAEMAAEQILALETRLAELHWTRVQNRDRTATYNRMTPDELNELAPGIDWAQYLADSPLPEIEAMVVMQPDFLQAVAGMWQDVPLAHWQNYQRYHLLRTSAPYMNEAFVTAHFDFFGRELSGQPAPRSRVRRAGDLVENLMGFAIGKVYVDRHFRPEAKARMEELVDNLLASFEVAIDNLEWMSDSTKVAAQEKLAKLNTKIAYPDVWRDYDCLQTDETQLLETVKRSAICEFQRNVDRLGQPVDRDEWGMTPQTVNAYYSPTMNEIVFPAGILQPPFFNMAADDAINYGAIGAVIGHEITHAFDDQGRRSDGDGNLRDWWEPEDEVQFRDRAQLMIDQYDAYEPIEGMHIQGALSLGENIADLGGLTVAYQAWQRSLGGAEAEVIDGYTGAQRFFLGYGQIWRSKYRDDAMRRQLTTGPHSPPKFRVRGALSNMPEFYEAFGVEIDDGMYRPEDVRVKIW